MPETPVSKFPTGALLDLGNVTVRTGNTNDPEITLVAKSKTALTSAHGADLVEVVARFRSMQNTKVTSMNVVTITGVDSVVGFLPVEDGKGALPVRWRKGGGLAGIDLKKYLAVKPFSVPAGSKAHIPVSVGEVAGFGHCLLVHFGQAEYRPVEKTEKKAKQSGSRKGESGAGAKPAVQQSEGKAAEENANKEVAAAATPAN